MEPIQAGQTIVVGIDFSECSERALLQSVALAEQRHAELELVHVFEWTGRAVAEDRPLAGGADATTSGLWRDVTAQAQVARQHLSQLCAAFVSDRVPAEVRVVIGDPVSGVLKAAEQRAASIIVLGATGRRALPRGALGTTAEAICAESPVPVLLVPLSEGKQKSLGQLQFLPARKRMSWSCVRCGTLQRIGASAGECVFCGDPFTTWVAMPEPRFTVASPR